MHIFNVENNGDVDDVLWRMQESSVAFRNFAKWHIFNRVADVLWFLIFNKLNTWKEVQAVFDVENY